LETVALRFPDAPALVFEDEVLSYTVLHGRANRFARHLAGLGIGAESIVALALPRSVDMVVALLGVIKAGAVYMPLDVGLPARRLAFQLNDSGAGLLVGDADSLCALTGTKTALPPALNLRDDSIQRRLDAYADAPLADCERAAPVLSDNLAYLIYTSGSTGTPKGAGNTHAGAVNRLVWMRTLLGTSSGDRVLEKTPLSFDISVWELLLPLISGATLVMARPEGHKDPRYIADIIRSERITILHFVPSMLIAFLEGADLRSCTTLRHIAVGGEAVSRSLCHRCLADHETAAFWNLYGPTEASIDVSFWRFKADFVGYAPPIGGPIWNTTLYVLDAGLRPSPVGVQGDLYIAGVGLARGYVGRPGLTAERFIACPFGPPGARMYRTGDLARWREDGALDFLGRADHQIKLRGFRIELGEIEAALTDIGSVAQAVVVAREIAGDTRLAAYLTITPGVRRPDAPALRAALAERLPDYMIPADFIILDMLPLTENGKIDRRALPAPARGDSGAAFVAPRTPREALVCDLLAELTGVAKVGVDDSFFALGGHSLLAFRLSSLLSRFHGFELPLSAIFGQPTPRAMAAALRRANAEAVPAIVPGEGQRDGIVTLSFGQVRSWVLDRIDGPSAAYNMPFGLRLQGQLDIAALGLALVDLVTRHMPLRTVIAARDGAPYGRLAPPPAAERILTIDDISALEPDDREAALRRGLAAEIAAPFDLGGETLLRARLFRLGETEHALALIVHHASCDGASAPVIFRDLGVAYAARLAGRAPEFAPLAVAYADYAAWQRRRLEQSGDLARETAYWRQRLAGVPEAASLPTDRPRLSGRARRAGHLPVAIDPDRVRSLKALAMARGATLFAVLLAAFAAILGRLARQEDIVVGCPVAGRATPELDPLIGFFVNTLALRIDLGGGPDAATLIRRVGDCLVEALTHQETPFERLVETLAVNRAPGQNPLFQVMFAWQSQEAIGDWEFPGIAAVAMAVPLPRAKFDLTLSLAPTPAGGVAGDWEYDADVFDASTTARWRLFWERLLDGFVRRPDVPVAALPLLSSEEGMLVTDTFNRTARDVPAGTIHGLFEQAAARNPTSIALLSAGESVSYGELDRGGNRFARYLAGRGVGPESVVALAAPRSIELIASMIGVLKAGAAYLPLDPAQPPRRLRMMIADSGAALLVVADKALADRIGAETIAPPALALDDPDLISRLAALSDDPIGDCERTAQASPDNIAYIMYTSGSTGTPKGVAATHRGVVNLAWRPTYAEITPNDTVLHGAPAAFDASTFEIWASLLNGARLSLAEDGPPDLERLSGQLERDRVTVAWLTAGLFDVVAKDHPGLLGRLRQLIVGGDVVSRAAAQRARAAHPALPMANGYGPTEATTFTSTYPIGALPSGAQTIPIGRPIGNARMLILDPSLSPVPIGVVGEIYVAGAGLARGYVGSPGLTAERFIACPFGPPGARMYRTGDLGLWRDDGTVEFHGRADAQIKLRGFRVEPAEIEAALCDIAEIAQAAVVPRRDSADVRLVAYLVPHPGRIAPAALDLRRALSRRLPEYMLPAFFVSLDALPLTPNGKVDRARLPSPATHAAIKSHAATMTERRLIEIWTDLLGREGIDAEADFFVLGGHSLLAIRFLAIAEAEFGRRIAAAAFFHSPTIKGVAKLIDSGAIVNRIAAAPSVGSEQRLAPKLRLVRSAIGVSRGRIVGMPGVAGHSAEIGIFAGNSLWDYDVWAVSVDPQGRRLTDDGLWLNVACEIAEQLIADDGQPLRAIVGFSIGGLMSWVVGRLLVAQGRDPTPIINLDGGAMHLHKSTWRMRIEPVLSGIDPAAATPMLLLHRQWPRRFAMIEHVDDDWRKVGVALQTLRYRTVCHLDFLCAAAIAASGDAFAAFIETGHVAASTPPDTFEFDTLGGDLFRLLDGAAPPEARAVQALLRDGAKLPDDIWVGDALIAAAIKAGDDELTLDIAARVAVKDPSSEVAACAQVCALLRLGRRDEAIALAEAWRREYPRKPAADALADRAHQGPAPSVATLTAPGFIDTLAMDRITGWAMDPAAPEEPVELELLVDGVVLLRMPANRQRPDLMLALGHSGCHAFSVRPPFPLSERQRRSVEVRRASDHGALLRAPGMIEPQVEAAAE
jgi:aspartate racemase